MKDTKQFYDCVQAIQSEILSSFDGFRINADIAQKAVDKFDLDTVKMVLANSITQKHNDARISKENKTWAIVDVENTIPMNDRPYCILDGNAGLLNIVANQFRKLERELEKPSALDQLSAIKADTVPKPKTTKSKDKEVR